MSGCPVRCKFCATGKIKKYRNLTATEIVEQVEFVMSKNPNYTFTDAKEYKMFAKEEIDVLGVPIIGIFTSSPSKAIKELKKFIKKPKAIIVMHWGWRNPKKFCKKFTKEFPDIKCVVPENGQEINFNKEFFSL